MHSESEEVSNGKENEVTNGKENEVTNGKENEVDIHEESTSQTLPKIGMLLEGE